MFREASCYKFFVKQGKKNKVSTSKQTWMATNTLSKAAFLLTVLSERLEYHNLAFRIGMFALELQRPPASTKALEVQNILKAVSVISIVLLECLCLWFPFKFLKLDHASVRSLKIVYTETKWVVHKSQACVDLPETWLEIPFHLGLSSLKGQPDISAKRPMISHEARVLKVFKCEQYILGLFCFKWSSLLLVIWSMFPVCLANLGRKNQPFVNWIVYTYIDEALWNVFLRMYCCSCFMFENCCSCWYFICWHMSMCTVQI